MERKLVISHRMIETGEKGDTGVAPGSLAAGNPQSCQSRNSSTPASLSQHSDCNETASIGQTSISHIPAPITRSGKGSGVPTGREWIMRSYKRTSVCWQVSVSQRWQVRYVCFFLLIHGHLFPPSLMGIPSAGEFLMLFEVPCARAWFLVEVLISSLIGKNPYVVDIKPCVISVADIFLVCHPPFKHIYGIKKNNYRHWKLQK